MKKWNTPTIKKLPITNTLGSKFSGAENNANSNNGFSGGGGGTNS